MADAICPTFAAGTISEIGVGETLDDFTLVTAPNGTANQKTYKNTVGSFNHSWSNGALSNTVLPTFSTSLVDFGTTGRQS